MNCYLHEQKQAIGTCVGCGKFICEECNTEVGGKNYCKKCIAEMMTNKKTFENQTQTNQTQPQTPMIFMNAGGGGGGSSSSSSSSSSSATAGSGRNGGMFPRQSILIHIVLFIFTAGIGNVIYFLYIKNKQSQWQG